MYCTLYIYTVCSVAHFVTPVYLCKVVFFATVCVCGVRGVCVCVMCFVMSHPSVSVMYAVILVCPLYTCE